MFPKGEWQMAKQRRILKRSDIPIFIRWFRGNALFWIIIGSITLFRWLGDISPLDIDAMSDGWLKIVVTLGLGGFLILFVFFGLPLILHEVAFSVVAMPAIKTALERQDAPGVLKSVPRPGPVVEAKTAKTPEDR